MKGVAKNISILEALGVMYGWREARSRIFFVFDRGDKGRWVTLGDISPDKRSVSVEFASGYHRRIALPKSGSISLLDSSSGTAPNIFGRRWDSFILVEYANGRRLFFCRPRLCNIPIEITR
jgi:hypothetical protein